jgi:hypothetical protein
MTPEQAESLSLSGARTVAFKIALRVMNRQNPPATE